MFNVEENRWVAPYHRRSPTATVRLFCFPYAGGGASVFARSLAQLTPRVEICPVQPPGRENRLSEPCPASVLAVAEAAAEALQPYFDMDFAIFGHSLGALYGYELLQVLRQNGGPSARHFIVSAHRAPHVLSPHPGRWQLPDAEFKQMLQDLNGTPREVQEHPELLALMLPLIRADFRLDATYSPALERRALDCPITAIGGTRDHDVPESHLREWRGWTAGRFDLKMIEGDHFFLHSKSSALSTFIVDALRAGPPKAPSSRNSSPNDRTPTECRPSASPPDTQIPRKPRTREP